MDASQKREQGGPCDVDTSDNSLQVVDQLLPMAQKIILLLYSVKLAMSLLLSLVKRMILYLPFAKSLQQSEICYIVT